MSGPYWHDLPAGAREARITRWQAGHPLDREQREERALAHANRRVIAERCHWPAGALADCERINARHPGWWITWSAAYRYSSRPAGFYGQQRDGKGRAYGKTARELEAEIQLQPDVRRGLTPVTPLVGRDRKS